MHDLNLNEISKKLNTNINSGLTTEEAKIRNKLGLNIIEDEKKTSFINKLLSQFDDILIMILLVAAVISMVINEDNIIDSIIILVVVLINAFVGAMQENKAQNALEEVKKLSSPKSKVVRNGRTYIIDSKEVCVGDILVFSSGDLISADARIIISNNLKVDESSLTGESINVEKKEGVLSNDTPLAERNNMVYASSVVTSGSGEAVVCFIGMDSEVGKIAKLLKDVKVDLTPLQIQLNKLGKVLGLICVIICMFVFVLEIFSGLSVIDSFNTSITLAVAAIPEGLATVVTIVLALGVQRLSKNNCIIRKLHSVETLGCASIICSDKTGTLTENKMDVKEIYSYSLDNIVVCNDYLIDEYKALLGYGALCSECKRLNNNELIGDSLDMSLINSNDLYGIKDLTSYKVIHSFPFSSERRLMSVIIRHKDNYIVITKGAVDSILNLCDKVNKEKILLANEKMASNGLRVIAIAIKKITDFSKINNVDYVESNLNFIGLVGFIDPIKNGVKESIQVAKNAGVTTIMITGDHLSTAFSIARKIGIASDKSQCISGKELDVLTDKELKENVTKYRVYARATPFHKVRIVNALKQNDLIVAMTGDGVNDAPSLRKADIGCAMGKKGTEVAKSAASLVLFDDNYNTIVTAIKEGRGIYNNIKKVIRFLLSSNIGEVVTIVLASLLTLLNIANIPLPLKPIHLLFVNLLTDLFPAFALGLDKVNDDVMNVLPRNKEESLLSKSNWISIFFQGLLIGLFSIFSFSVGFKYSYEIGLTMAFVTLSFSQLFHAFNVRNEKSIFNKNILDNKYLIYSFLFGAVFEILVINVPFLYNIFSLSPLDFTQCFIAIGLAFMIVIVEEFRKEVKRLIK